MSGLSLTALGVKTMVASYAKLQTASHNIANANVAGYSRQQVNLATSQGLLTGQGFFGQGVDIASVTRQHDAFLAREATSKSALAAMDAKRLQHLGDLEAVFKTGEYGLGQATSDLMAAFVDLSSRPADLATRQVVLAKAGEWASRFNEASRGLDDSQNRVGMELAATVGQVNSLLVDIARSNQRIVAAQGQQAAPNDLLDQRDRLIKQLAGLVQVSRIDAADGSANLFTAQGERLVLGTDAVQMKLFGHDSDPQRWAVGFEDFGVRHVVDESTLGGGELAGLMRYQNDDLATGRNLVGRLAASVAAAVNTQQTLGLNLLAPAGQVPSGPLFATGPAVALPYRNNATTPAGDFIGSVSLALAEPSQLQASDYELAEVPSAPGSWQVTRLADGKVQAVASGDTVDGVRIDFGVPPPQSGDRFLLQPVAQAASGIKRLINDPRELAAASPLLASAGAANQGTVSVASVSVSALPLPVPGATARIAFTNDSGAYNWALVDAANTVLASGAGTWVAGQSLPAPPTNINGFAMQLQGVPRTGDTLTVAPTPSNAVANNNGNALLLAALQAAAISGGRSAIEAWSQAVSDVGVRVQGAQTASDISTAVATSTQQSLGAASGVNLDEEAAALIQYQQSYQAAAKVLQVAQSLFDSVLNATGR